MWPLAWLLPFLFLLVQPQLSLPQKSLRHAPQPMASFPGPAGASFLFPGHG